MPIGPRLRQQPGAGPGRLGWLAWFKMLLAWGGGVGGGGGEGEGGAILYQFS